MRSIYDSAYKAELKKQKQGGEVSSTVKAGEKAKIIQERPTDGGLVGKVQEAEQGLEFESQIISKLEPQQTEAKALATTTQVVQAAQKLDGQTPPPTTNEGQEQVTAQPTSSKDVVVESGNVQVQKDIPPKQKETLPTPDWIFDSQPVTDNTNTPKHTEVIESIAQEASPQNRDGKLVKANSKSSKGGKSSKRQSQSQKSDSGQREQSTISKKKKNRFSIRKNKKPLVM